jgi:hypothetical protein
MDLLIKNGTVVTASGSFEADVAVDQGKITAVGRNLPLKAEKTVDASGKLVLAGCHRCAYAYADAFWRNCFRRQLSQEPGQQSAEVLPPFLIIRCSTRERRSWDWSIPKRNLRDGCLQ